MARTGNTYDENGDIVFPYTIFSAVFSDDLKQNLNNAFDNVRKSYTEMFLGNGENYKGARDPYTRKDFTTWGDAIKYIDRELHYNKDIYSEMGQVPLSMISLRVNGVNFWVMNHVFSYANDSFSQAIFGPFDTDGISIWSASDKWNVAFRSVNGAYNTKWKKMPLDVALYTNATETTDGLMSSVDKKAVDDLQKSTIKNISYDYSGSLLSYTMYDGRKYNIAFPNASESTAGLMSPLDKHKINGLEKEISTLWGNVNIIRVTSNDKSVNIETDTADDELIDVHSIGGATSVSAGVMTAEDKRKLDSFSREEIDSIKEDIANVREKAKQYATKAYMEEIEKELDELSARVTKITSKVVSYDIYNVDDLIINGTYYIGCVDGEDETVPEYGEPVYVEVIKSAGDFFIQKMYGKTLARKRSCIDGHFTDWSFI